MAGRYGPWKRLRGDTDRPELIAYGNKLLGYLTEQRQLSGVKTQEVTRTLSDGAMVRARFVRDQPLIEISYPKGKKKQGSLPIDGFVMKPHVHGTPVTGKNEVLLMPDDAYKAFYFDHDEAPTTEHFKWYPYGKNLGGEDQFPAPDALQHAGNVDWRNKDESLIVSWWGPNSRYFADEGTVRTKVYHNGKLLFDLDDIDTDAYPDFDGYIARSVYGAAVRQTDTGYLLLIAGLLYASAMVRKDFLMQVALRILPASPARQLGLLLPLAPRLEAYANDDLKLLWTRARTSDEIFNESDYAHPFVFNQSATEARRLRAGWNSTGAGADAVMVEETIDCLDFDAIAYDRTEHPTSKTTTATNTDVVIDVLAREGSFQYEGDYAADPPPTYTEDGKRQAPYINHLAFLKSGNATTAIAVTPQKIAVDYRDDEPVYAYWTAGARDDSSSISGSQTMSAFDKEFTTLVNVAGQWDPGSTYTWHENRHDTFTTSFAHSGSLLAGRLTLPEETIEAFTTRERTSTFTGEVTYHFERSWGEPYGHGTNAGTEELVLDDLRIQRKLIPYFLDLRSGLVVTGIFAVSEHNAVVSIVNTINTTLDSTTGAAPDLGGTVADPSNARTVTARIDTRISVKGAQVASSFATSTPVVTALTVPSAPGGFVGDFDSFAIGIQYRRWDDPCSTPLDPPFLDAANPVVHYSQHRSTDAEVGITSAGTGREGPEVLPSDNSTSDSAHATLAPDNPGTIFSFVADSGRTGSVSLTWMTEYPFTDESTLRTFGGWASYKDFIAVSMPWPANNLNTANRLHRTGTALKFSKDVNLISGQPAKTSFAPIWVLAQTDYLTPPTG